MNLSFLPFVVAMFLCNTIAHSQHLGILVHDHDRDRTLCLTYCLDTLTQAKIQLSKSHDLELSFVQKQKTISTAKLWPSSAIHHEPEVRFPFSALTDDLVIIGSLPGCDLKADIIQEALSNVQGLMEERLVKVAERIEEECPEFIDAEVGIYKTDQIDISTSITELKVARSEGSSAPSTLLTTQIRPYLISHLEDLAQSCTYMVKEHNRTVQIMIPEKLAVYPVQLKLLDNSGRVLSHRGLNSSTTEVVIRRDQWSAEFNLQVLYQNEEILWNETWSSLKTE